MKFLDNYGNDVDSNMAYRVRPPFEVDESVSNTTFIRYEDSPVCVIKKIAVAGGTTTTTINYGAWEDRNTMSGWIGVNEHLCTDLARGTLTVVTPVTAIFEEGETMIVGLTASTNNGKRIKFSGNTAFPEGFQLLEGGTIVATGATVADYDFPIFVTCTGCTSASISVRVVVNEYDELAHL